MTSYLGKQFGNYDVIRLLGEGGFAEVYLGKHRHLNTLAAIKVLRQIRFAEPELVQFRLEAQTIARLVHPNIVRVLDFGMQDTTLFLVIEYAPNGTLRQLCPRGRQLPLATVVSYTKQIADALQYAHDQKLIHRDVKPENMLLGSHHEVLLSDFGLVVIIQSSRSLSTQEVAGSGLYMAPEQIQGRPQRASDQYALGICVYEWISGHHPFHGSFYEVISQHMLAPPPPLHTVAPGIPSAVEEVVLTALRKDPGERFASVLDFANALDRAMTSPSSFGLIPPMQLRRTPQLNEGPSQVSYRTIPFTESNDTPVKDIRSAAVHRPKRSLSLRTLVASLASLVRENVASRASPRTAEHGRSIDASPDSLLPSPISAGATLVIYRGHYGVGPVFGVGWSPDGKRIASGASDRRIQVWEALDGTSNFTYSQHEKTVTSVVWSPDGKRIASTSDDGTAQIWNTSNGETISIFKTHGADAHCAAWSPDGRYIAFSDDDGRVYIWDTETEQKDALFIYSEHRGAAWDITWSPDQTRIASCSSDGTIHVWEVFSGNSRVIYREHTDELRGVAWSPDGHYIASCGLDKTVQVWETASGKKRVLYGAHADLVDHVAWSPDSIHIASGSGDATVQVWEALNGKTNVIYRGHRDRVRCLQWSPDGRDIVSSSYDRTVHIWRVF
jgi:WD40 repeat protein/tRNA A-37 threonylcarbamoyl transferase component Bud32